MNMEIKNNCLNIDWSYVSETLKKVGMAYYDAKIHKKAFENSHTVVFVFDNGILIGFGRAISDGVYQAAIYDVAVLPEYQGKGIGKIIVNNILKHLPNCNLYYMLHLAKRYSTKS